MLLGPFDYVPLIMMGLALMLFLISIVRLWPDLMKERRADAEETKRLHAEAQTAQTAVDQHG
jgi:hypothetical protein